MNWKWTCSFVFAATLGSWGIGLQEGAFADGRAPAVPPIVPDNTLGHEASRIQAINEQRDLVEGGARRGANVFHSFEQFNIETLREVYFANPQGVETILSRVTGTNVSDIDGTLGVLGNADLFFLNPNGIVFGPNARLDIAGSFVGTTADGFTFPDGQVFSAVDPEAPPLLTLNVTPGLQWGNGSPLAKGELEGVREGWGEVVVHHSHLSVGESLTLAGQSLDLTGQLDAGRNLNLWGLETVQLRDSERMPFVAEAGKHLWLQGNRALDISVLAHPASGLVAGRDLVLRSRRPVIGDGHFEAGRSLRVERLNGQLGWLRSEDDPVIRADGDVRFRDYTGASLHILAGGSVTIPGPITITGVDTTENSLRESVTLSDGVTVVEIDGAAEPTLDIRAGVRGQGSEGAGGQGRSANIRLGNIRNRGGRVFITNQYRPNLDLGGGDIEVGAIDTRVVDPIEGMSRGGDVVIDSRGSIDIAGDVTTFARAGNVQLQLAEDNFLDIEIELDGDDMPIIDFAKKDDVRAIGGNIMLLSGNNVTTQNLNTSAVAAARGEETRSLQTDGTERVQTGNARAVAQGGNITVATQVDRSRLPVEVSIGNIETGNINTSARTVVNTSADASVSVEVEVDGNNPASAINRSDAGIAISGNATSRTEGGAIDLSTQVTGGDIIDNSDVGVIRTRNINSSVSTFVYADTDASTSASVSSYVAAASYVAAENRGNGGSATSGAVEYLSTQAGAIDLNTQVSVRDIRAVSDVGILQTENIDAAAAAIARTYAYASTSTPVYYGTYGLISADNKGNGGSATSGAVEHLSTQAGAIDLRTQVNVGDIMAESDVGNLQTTSIDASSSAIAYSGAMATAATTVAAIAYSEATAAIATATATAENRGNGGRTAGSNIQGFSSQGGAIDLSTQINGGNIMAEADVGTLQTENIDAAAAASAAVSASANAAISSATSATVSAPANTAVSVNAFARASIENRGDGGYATGGNIQSVSAQGGAINLRTQVTVGDIRAASDVGTLQTADVDSSTYAGAFALAFTEAFARVANNVEASVSAENSGDGGRATGGDIQSVSAQGGAINLSTQVTGDDVRGESKVGTLQTTDLDSSAKVEAFVSARSVTAAAAVDAAAANSGDGGHATSGDIQRSISYQGGVINLSTQATVGHIIAESDVGTLQTSDIASSTNARAFTVARSDATAAVVATDPVDSRTIADADNGGDGGHATGGKIQSIFSQEGVIDLRTQVTVGHIRVASDVGTLQTSDVDSSTYAGALALTVAEAFARVANNVEASVSAENSGDGGRTTGGNIQRVSAQGGAINLRTQVNGGNVRGESNVGTLQTTDINSSAKVEAFVSARSGTAAVAAENSGDGGHATSGDIQSISHQGGAINLRSQVNGGHIMARSDIGTLQTADITSSTNARAFAVALSDATATATTASENRGDGGYAIGGNIQRIFSQEGAINLRTRVSGKNIITGSDIASLRTGNVDSSAFVDVFTLATAAAENRGIGGNATGGTITNLSIETGEVSLRTWVNGGHIRAASDVGSLQTFNVNSSVAARAFAFADADAEKRSNGGIADAGTITKLSTRAGAIDFRTQVNGESIMAESAIGSLQIADVSSSVDARAFAFANALDGDSNILDTSVRAWAGEIELRTLVSAESSISGTTIAEIQTGQLDSVASAFADLSANLTAPSTKRNPGTEGTNEVDTTNDIAIANAGNITLTTDIRGGVRGTSPDQGMIRLDAEVNTSARALADITPEGEEEQFSIARFSARGGSIEFDADGQIELGENSTLNASAGLVSQFGTEANDFDMARLRGGKITLTALSSILLNEISAETNSEFIQEANEPVINAETLANSAGRLTIQTPDTVRLRNDALVSVSATGGSGDAGTMRISARSLILGEQSEISSQTDSGDGGNIIINLQPNLGELLLLQPGSSISTTAGTEGKGGDGGDIIINALFILTLPEGNSDITANAFEGRGGEIDIDAAGVLGLTPRSQRTALSDITASSNLGVDGNVEISTLSTAPVPSAIHLPTAPVNLSVQQQCTPGEQTNFSFFDIGRGGVPTNPDDVLTTNAITETWTELPADSNSLDAKPLTEQLSSQRTIYLSEQGMVFLNPETEEGVWQSHAIGDRPSTPSQNRPLLVSCHTVL